MKKTIKILPMLLLAGLLFSCTTEVADFDSVKDAKETAEQEAKEVEKEAKEQAPKQKDVFERQKNPDTLTFDDSSELRNVLSNNLSDEEYKKFFTDNQYNIIEFDGAIDLIELIPEKKTRYTLLLRAGDYDANSQTGPIFKVKDVGATDSSVKELFLTGNGEVGKQVKIKASIDGYNDKAGYVELKLISVTKR